LISLRFPVKLQRLRAAISAVSVAAGEALNSSMLPPVSEALKRALNDLHEADEAIHRTECGRTSDIALCEGIGDRAARKRIKKGQIKTLDDVPPSGNDPELRVARHRVDMQHYFAQAQDSRDSRKEKRCARRTERQ
jgi:hypothetical protein